MVTEKQIKAIKSTVSKELKLHLKEFNEAEKGSILKGIIGTQIHINVGELHSLNQVLKLFK